MMLFGLLFLRCREHILGFSAGMGTHRRKRFLRDVGPAVARSSYEQGGRWACRGSGEKTMRVMVLVKATRDSEAGIMPSTELLEAMGRYNEQLANAGILLAGEGPDPSPRGNHVAFCGANRTLLARPFPEP